MGLNRILKRAWHIAWTNRVIWIVAVIAGGAPNVSWNSPSSEYGNPAEALSRGLQQLIGPTEVVVALFGITWAIVSVAASGGLMRMTRDADGGASISVGAAFRDGWRAWWPLFFLSLCEFLIALLIVLMAAAPMLPTFFSSRFEPTGLEFLGCFTLPLGFILMIALAIFVLPGFEIGRRYALLGKRNAMQALSEGFAALKVHRKDAVMLGLVLIGIGFVVGIPIALLSFPFAFFAQSLPDSNVAARVGAQLLGWALMAVPSALLLAFTSASWTVLFNRLTGHVPDPEAPLLLAPPPPQPATQAAYDATGAYPPAPPAPPAPGA